jgi:hypothetical protein
MPGERLIVLASPGFFAQASEAIKATAEVLELAAKNEVVISGVGARGLILAEEEEDVTQKAGGSRRSPPKASSPDQLWIRYRRESARADGDVMRDLAEGTGGTLYHDRNDLTAGFEKVTSPPEFWYVLGFSPTDFHADGSFHALKVRLRNANGTSVEARRGYYAVESDPAHTQAKVALQEAVFARTERSDIPIVLQTGYSKPNNADAGKVLVVAKIEVSSLRFEKKDGRSLGAVDIVVALFDSDGGYVTAAAETAKLDLSDEVLARPDAAVTLRWEFPDVNAGSYSVRLVVLEPRSMAMTTINRTLAVR